MLKIITLFLRITCLLFACCQAAQLPIIVVIPSYNNQEWCERNVLSALEQNYNNYHIVYINDSSTDATGQLVHTVASRHPHRAKITIINNQKRQGALANLYHIIHTCPDNAIIVTLDGDDWFPHSQVLQRINGEYADPATWMTYGSYLSWPDNKRDSWIHKIPDTVIANKTYRQYQWVTTHLRTFYARLFKMIHKEDLLYEGEFFPMTWDLAFMFPMLEIARHHAHYIDDILYVYNRRNPIGDRNSNRELQIKFESIIRAKVSYASIDKLFEK